MGVVFKIKKIDVENYLEGSKVLLTTYDTYKTKDQQAEAADGKMSVAKAKAHMIDILMAGVVEPQLSRKLEDGKTFVEYLFTEPELAAGLYQAIVEFTFGKKKVRAGLRKTGSLKSTP